MKVTISDYNHQWPSLFQSEKLVLEKNIQDKTISIEHIGSTAVNGLAAKPIIDILIGLKNFDEAEKYLPTIINAGYQYISKHEDVMPYRRFFIKEKYTIRTHHIHMVGIDTEFWRRHLAFRDYLRINPLAKLTYGNLKKELSEKEWKDGNEYAGAKSDYIRGIEKLIMNL